MLVDDIFELAQIDLLHFTWFKIYDDNLFEQNIVILKIKSDL